MLLSQALRFLFQGKGGFRVLLLLALIQLLPIVGQLILLGYGLDIVRAVYAEQTGLPPLHWLSALGNGLRLLLAGLGYLLPLLITIGLLGASSSGGSSSSVGVIGILLAVGLPLLIFFMSLVSNAVRKRPPSSMRSPRGRGDGRRSLLTGLLPIVVTIAGILVLRSLVSLAGLDAGKPNGLSILLLVILACFLFLLTIVWSVGGARYALEQKGLLDPMRNVGFLLKNRALTGIFFLNVLLLCLIALVGTMIGLVLFILPGLFVFVTGSLAFWYLVACYCQNIGMPRKLVEQSVVSPN